MTLCRFMLMLYSQTWTGLSEEVCSRQAYDINLFIYLQNTDPGVPARNPR